VSATDLFAGHGASGVFRSNNNGDNWVSFSFGLTNRIVEAVAVSGARILAGTRGGGVFFVDVINVATVSAASFTAPVATESVVAAFGVGLAGVTQVASTIPLPTTLAQTRVAVRDAAGVERNAQLFFVSPTQVNLFIPVGTTTGTATVTVFRGTDSVSQGTLQIQTVAPGLFTANVDGRGPAAALALRVKSDNTQLFEQIVQFDQVLNRFVTSPIDLGPQGERVFLILFGTGLRFNSGLSGVVATLGGTATPVSFAGAQGGFVGLDQINIEILRSLIGRGEVDVVVGVDGRMANTVRVNIK
jgi:uncharacterized protein (TIGR03437 family)